MAFLSKRRLRGLSSLLLGLVLCACTVNPVTGRKELSLVSEADEIAIGNEQYFSSQQVQGGRYDLDPELTTYVAEVGARLAAVSDRALPYEFVVLNDGTPNAWALPGGKIAVNRGLLSELKNEAELAAVLGHEIVHAAARHGAQGMTRGLLMQGALVASSIALADNQGADYILGGAALGAQLVTQKYSRNAESEADHYGMEYMARAGYDPAAAVELQQTFVRLAEGRKPGWIDGLFASHPPSQERVAANRARLAEMQTGGETYAQRYQDRTSKLRKRLPAYAAAERASKALHEKKQGVAMDEINKAIQLEPAEARFYALKGDIHFSRSDYESARRSYDQAISRDPEWFQNYLGRGLAMARLGRADEARADLERSNKIVPTALATNELGQIALRDHRREDAKEYFKQASSAGGELGQRAGYEFTRLDIEDNPSGYVEVRLVPDTDTRLLVQVFNRAPIDLEEVSLRLYRGYEFLGTVQVPELPASATVVRPTRIRVADGAELAQYSVQVYTAFLSER